MELPQSRPFGTEGRKATHDFLSLYSHSTIQQEDQRTPSAGGYLKTHDFLQVGKTNAKEENTVEISSTVEKPPPPAPPPSSSVEHILPGGIGTYSMSHISYCGQKFPKPEGTIFTVAQASSTEKNDENSNCSSYSGSGFTLWEESAVKKGKTGKENVVERPTIGRVGTGKAGPWTSQSSSNSDSHRNSFSSLSSSQALGLKSQSIEEMIKSAKSSTIDEDLDDDEEFILKKGNSTTTTHKGELRVKVDGKSNAQKPNTPRSKHSATEQRRRSKINDRGFYRLRFQMLRELIPHSDQKRDKASFLLEVIEYILVLQEKVHKYEGPYLGWNQEPTKLVPWRNNQNSTESYVDQSRGINNGSGPALVFAAKLDEKKVPISPAIPGIAHNTVESDNMSTATTYKTMDNQPGITNKPMRFPMSLRPNCYNPVRNGGISAQIPCKLASDAENMTYHPQAQLGNTRSCTSDWDTTDDKLKEQNLTVEGGTINISTVYSQGLLNTLTQALQNSGVDLSQASISVQIDLGKRAIGTSILPASAVKDNEVPTSNQGTKRSRVGNCESSDQAIKKQRTDES